MEITNTFINEFKDYRVSDIKSLFKLQDEKDEGLEKYFNAINNDIMNENISEKFGNNFELQQNNQIEQTVMLIKYIYGPIINGRILYDIMKNFLNNNKTKSSDNSLVDFEDLKQYQEMIYYFFNHRYQINLDDKEDKDLFIKMLSKSEEFKENKKTRKVEKETSKSFAEPQSMYKNVNTFNPITNNNNLMEQTIKLKLVCDIEYY
jgi:hypothetical protein